MAENSFSSFCKEITMKRTGIVQAVPGLVDGFGPHHNGPLHSQTVNCFAMRSGHSALRKFGLNCLAERRTLVALLF